MGFLPAFASGPTRSLGGTGLKARYHQLVQHWHRSKARRQSVARYTRELETYTNRELSELGLSRADIPAVARGTYRHG